MSTVVVRVERIRELSFIHAPNVQMLSADGIRAIDASYFPELEFGRAASAFVRPVPVAELPEFERLEALELLGEAPVGTTVGEMLSGSNDPGGLFNPRGGEVYIRRGSDVAAGGEEGVLAHELTHALEYQHNLHPQLRTGSSDQSEAARSLIEGAAVVVQYIYARRYFGFHGTIARFLVPLSRYARRRLRLPPVLLADALFPYVAGAPIIGHILAAGGWRAVTAIELHPPGTTQQLLTGRRSAVPAPMFDAARILGRRWRPEPRQTFGDYDTALLITRGTAMPDDPLVRLWRAGYVQLWNDLRYAHITTCRRPCAAHYILLARWRWTTARTAVEVAARVRTALSPILTVASHPAHDETTRLGSSVSVGASGRTTTIVLAPSRALADALAAAHPWRMN